MSFRNCVRHILETADLGDLLEVGVFALHTHVPCIDQGPGPIDFNRIIHVIMTQLYILPNNLARKMHHIMHFWSYVGFRITSNK